MDNRAIIRFAVLLLAVIGVFILRSFAGTWIRALASGAPVAISDIMSLRRKRIPVNMVIDAYIISRKVGLSITFQEITEMYQAQPDSFVDRVREMVRKQNETKQA